MEKIYIFVALYLQQVSTVLRGRTKGNLCMQSASTPFTTGRNTHLTALCVSCCPGENIFHEKGVSFNKLALKNPKTNMLNV